MQIAVIKMENNIVSIKMMIDYFNRLKELQEDRIKFQKQKDRSSFKDKISKQESKYQAYIIDQMNEKNQLIAASKIQGILSGEVNKISASVFQAIHTFGCEVQRKGEVSSVGQVLTEGSLREDSMSVNFILVKLCTDSIRRVLKKASLENTRVALKEIQNFCKKKKVLDKGIKILNSYYLKHSFRKLINHSTRQTNHLETEGKFFDESFSVIYKDERQRDRKVPVGMSESYLSFILDKESQPQTDFHIQRESNQTISKQKQEISNLQEDLAYLRNLLAERTLQLKKKTLQCEQLQQESRFQDNSGYESKNSSYLSQMQRQLTGGKRIRKNISRLSDSNSSLKGEEISRELLSKYMKQSFKLKENMDLARELCIEIHQKLSPDFKRQIQTVIKTLTTDDEPSMLDEI